MKSGFTAQIDKYMDLLNQLLAVKALAFSISDFQARLPKEAGVGSGSK